MISVIESGHCLIPDREVLPSNVPDESTANPNGLDAGNLWISPQRPTATSTFPTSRPKDEALFSTPNPHRARQP
jgi:hypothetical protein